MKEYLAGNRDANKVSTGHRGILRNNHIPALALAVAGAVAAACAEKDDNNQLPPPPAIEELLQATGNVRTINDLNPPRAPFVLPLQNGVRTRVSQRASGDVSHWRNSTLHAVDFADEIFSFDNRTGDHDGRGLALAPVSGMIHRNQGNCNAHSHVINNFCDVDGDGDKECCPGLCCNGGWGNTVELIGRDGQMYISSHCSSFRDESPEGAFVLRGTPLCRIGSTGASDAPHLHFDAVAPAASGRYGSMGVHQYIATRVGETEPSLLTPDNFETCCYSCADRPGQTGCAEYISFNRSLKETLQTLISEIQRADPRRMQLQGNMAIDAGRSQQYSPLIYVYQDITMEVNGTRVPSRIYLIHTTPSLAGQRNPFLDTAYAYVWNPTNQQWESHGLRAKTHTERFINFDLWDFANSKLTEQERAALSGGNLPFTQRVHERPNWNSDWELYSTRFNTTSAGSMDAFLAVLKQNRGVRAACAYRNGAWSDWYIM